MCTSINCQIFRKESITYFGPRYFLLITDSLTDEWYHAPLTLKSDESPPSLSNTEQSNLTTGPKAGLWTHTFICTSCEGASSPENCSGPSSADTRTSSSELASHRLRSTSCERGASCSREKPDGKIGSWRVCFEKARSIDQWLGANFRVKRVGHWRVRGSKE